MGMLFRFGLVGFGAFLFVGGINEAINGERVSDTPERVSVTEASALAQRGGKAYFTIDAGADLSRAIYETGLTEPYFTRVAPGTITTLPSSMGAFGNDNFADLNGAVVRHSGALLPTRVIVESVSVEGGESASEGTLNGVRVIATASDHPGGLFVVSPFFRSEQDPEYTAWLQQTSFQGRLCKVSQADANVKTEKNFQQVLDLYRQNGLPANSGGYVLLTRDASQTPYYGPGYAPVQGGKSSVLARFDSAETSGLYAGVSGVASSRSAGSLPGVQGFFPGLSGQFVVVDTTQTGADLNNASSNAARLGIILGAIFMGSGGFLFWNGAKRQQRHAQQQEQAYLQQYMAQKHDAGAGESQSFSEYRDAA